MEYENSSQSTPEYSDSSDDIADLNAHHQKISIHSLLKKKKKPKEEKVEKNINDTFDSDDIPDLYAFKPQNNSKHTSLIIAFVSFMLLAIAGILMAYTYLFEEKIEAVALAIALEANRTEMPSLMSSSVPSNSKVPTSNPSTYPSVFPSYLPSTSPTNIPSLFFSSTPSSYVPSVFPSQLPSIIPSQIPTHPTAKPTYIDFYPETVTFLVIGDVPYNEGAMSILSAQIDGIKEYDENDTVTPDFLVHVGDLTRASTSKCRNEWYSKVANILRQSSIPVFVTPGDNDYIDCPDPAEALKRWRSHFEYFDRRHWNHNLRVEYQDNRPENVAFFQKGVLFITVHIIAPAKEDYDYDYDERQAYQKRQEEEWSSRHQDDATWVELQVRKHVEHGQMNRVIIFGHASPRSVHDDFFDPIKMLAREYSSIPFTYIHGDGHSYERVVFNSRTMLRVQVEEGENEGPLFCEVNHPDLAQSTIDFQRARRNKRN